METNLFRPTWVEINLQAIKNNFRELTKRAGNCSVVMPVIKANAYGHGVIRVAKAMEESGAEYLAVATLEEALEIRDAGISIPILIFGYVPVTAVETILMYDLTVTILDDRMIGELHNASLVHKKKAKVHIKVDTGMGRLGILSCKQFQETIELINEHSGVELEGMYTHFACSDELDKSYTTQQYEQFKPYIEIINTLPSKPFIHVSNSAGIIDTPQYSHDFVRAGISLYGYYPSAEVDRLAVKLEPSMEFKTRIGYLKEVDKGSCISYGGTYCSNRKTQIATLPVGYADGYNRLLSNCGSVLIRGVKAPVIGRICMDQTMVDVTDVPNVQIGDEVVLFGKQQRQQITVEDIANQLNTINYEVVCAVSKRVPRIYV